MQVPRKEDEAMLGHEIDGSGVAGCSLDEAHDWWKEGNTAKEYVAFVKGGAQ